MSVEENILQSTSDDSVPTADLTREGSVVLAATSTVSSTDGFIHRGVNLFHPDTLLLEI